MSLTPTDRSELLLPDVRQIALDAGEKILQIYRTGYQVFDKADGSPVTSADYAAHHLIAERLQALGLGWPVLSEETDPPRSWAVRQKWQTYWLVDPLDGTRELLKRKPEFTVNIALIHRHEPILGVVFAPAVPALYYASRNQGAWRETSKDAPQRIRTGQALPPIDVAGNSPTPGPTMQQLLRNLGPHTLHRVGSSLKSCWVAEGRIDLYPRHGPTSEWDTAAAQCVVEEAGGRLVNWQLKRLRYNQKASTVNPSFLVVGDPDYDWSAVLSGIVDPLD